MYLASTCNSTVVEIDGDIIRVSHGFDGCQRLGYIEAVISIGVLFLIGRYKFVEYSNVRLLNDCKYQKAPLKQY